MWTTSIPLLLLLLAHDADSRVLRMQLYSGDSGERYWSGVLQCPVDFDINVKNFTIERLCSGFNCTAWHTYRESNLKQIRDNCTDVNMCTVKLWETSLLDGEDVKIEYECQSDRLREFFSNAMVKRFYDSEDFTPQYCKEYRHQRSIDDDNNNKSRLPSVNLTFQMMAERRASLLGYPPMRYGFTTSGKGITQYRGRRNKGKILPIHITTLLHDNNMRSYQTRKPLEKNDTDNAYDLVPLRLGGSGSHSLVPMARDLNRPQGIWHGHADMVRKWLRENTQKHVVRWEVIVFYSLVKTKKPFRPIAFALRYTKLTDYFDHPENGIEHIETFINENEEHGKDQCSPDLGNMFKYDDDDLTLDY